MAISIGTKIAGAALVGTLAVGAGAAAWASAGAGGSSASTGTLAAETAANVTAAPSAGGAGGGARVGRGGLALLRRADHGDLEIRAKGSKAWETVTFDRGKVSDVAADHVTLARPDGQSVTMKVDGSTAFHGVTSWQEVQKGSPAIVISKNGTATQVFQHKAPAPAAAG